MLVYLWSAEAQGHYAGVTDDQMRARQAAEACLSTGQAGSAHVETAVFVSGSALIPYYRRTGRGWAATCRDGEVTWVPLRVAS